MSEKPGDKKTAPLLRPGNIVRFWVLVAGLFILIRIFGFQDIQIYCVASCSMEPTLYGDTQNADRILVNCLAYKIGDPHRWDVAVFKFPENCLNYTAEAGKTYIKRIVGLPGDKIKISGGDVYRYDYEHNEFVVLRKPDVVQEALWHTVFSQRYDNAKDDWALGEHWSAEGDAFVYDGESQSDVTEITFKPESEGGDLLLACEITVESGSGGIGLWLQEDLDMAVQVENLFGVRMAAEGTPSGKWTPVLRLNHNNVTEVPPTLAIGRTYRIEMSNVDDRVTLKIDGEVVYTHDYTEDNPSVAPRPQVTIRARGIRVRLTDVVVKQDVYYTDDDPQIHYALSSKPCELQADEYFMLGDNSAASSDSRMWGKVPRRLLIGRAFFILRPLNRFSFIK